MCVNEKLSRWFTVVCLCVMSSLLVAFLPSATVGAAKGNAAPRRVKAQVPAVFKQLGNYKVADRNRYIIKYRIRPMVWVAEYDFKTTNNMPLYCSLGTVGDLSRDIDCQGQKVPNINNSAIKKPGLISLEITHKAELARGEGARRPQMDEEHIPYVRTLHVGYKLYIPKVPKKDLGDSEGWFNYDVTCVVPDKDTVGCINGLNNGFLIDKKGTHLF